MIDVQVKSLDDLLNESSATPEFKQAVRALSAGKPQDLIQFNRHSPPVKVGRFVMKLLEAYPELPLESLKVNGQSGCSEYVGEATAQPNDVSFDFEWDCRWRAEEQGWTDAFGDPDQIRAARAYGYQCFKRLERR